MLHNCPSIEYLDISNFDPININNADSMFDNFENIKYINLNNMTNDYIISRIKSSNLKNKNDLIVCQNNNKPIIDNVNAIYDCLYFEENSLKSDSNNYITVKYNNESKYTSGFKLDNIKTRKEINYIIYQDSIFINDNPFIIEANKSIEIHFTNIIDNLENFFNDELDSNCRNIISIDLSYFNSTLIGNIDNIFSNCTSLSYLDISNFDFGKIASSNSIMIHWKNEISENPNLNTKNDLTICQTEDIIINENATYICNYPKHDSTNYIIIYFGNDVVYEKGFSYNNEDTNEYRKDIEFINIENNTFSPSNYLEIKAGSKVEINLLNSTQSLAHFFDSNYDLNMKNVTSIDFTYFDFSIPI